MFLKDLYEIWQCRFCSPIFFSVIVWNCPSWNNSIVKTRTNTLPCSAFCAGEHCPNLSQIVTIECKFTTELIIAVWPWESLDPNAVSQNQMFFSLLLIVSNFLESLYYATALSKDIGFIQATKIKTSHFYQLLATFTALWNYNFYNNSKVVTIFYFYFYFFISIF